MKVFCVLKAVLLSSGYKYRTEVWCISANKPQKKEVKSLLKL